MFLSRAKDGVEEITYLLTYFYTDDLLEWFDQAIVIFT